MLSLGLVNMRDMYIKTGLGFLLVFSITSAASLEEIANLRDEIIRIKDDENIPIVIVGNKADLEENRAVPRAKGFSISQRWEAPYYESSARTKSESLTASTELILTVQPTSMKSSSTSAVRCCDETTT